ncbi:putative lipid II flippase FtsW [Patescibacteria group bacterium]
MVSLKKQKKEIDKRLLIVTLLLVAIGLVSVADASAPQALNTFGDKYYFIKQQAMWAVLGIVALFVFSKIKYTFWEKLAVPLFFINIALLVVVLIPSFGLKTLGARRWIVAGPLRFQPSELIKITLALYFAKLARGDKSILAYIIPLGLVSVLMMLQPDLGTTMVIAAIGLSQIFVSGANFIHFTLVVIGGAGASIALILTSTYRRARLMTFVTQSTDPLGKSYHIRQVLLALGTGGIFGVGLGASRQKYLFLPEAASDSIFAVIAEEVGFIGASLVIIIFALYVFTALKIAARAPDTFSKVLATGIAVWIGAQVFLNIGSMIALVPLTGVPLPFLSYGGSALVMALSATGILLNISKFGSKTYDTKRKGK